MKRSYPLTILIISLALVVFSSPLFGEENSPKNIILIGWDGAQRNHIKECLAKNELPNLKQISSEGNLVAVDILRITDTKAGWSQILTGYDPEITGVYNNGNYQPIPEGYTIFERLEKHFGADNIYTAAVIGKKAHVDNEGPKKIKETEDDKEIEKQAPDKKLNKQNNKQDKKQNNKKAAQKNAIAKKQKKAPEGKIITENGIQYRVVPGKPYFNASKNMDIFVNGLQMNDRVTSKAASLIEKNKDKKFFFFIHYAEIDHQGHKYGENSKEVNDAYISCDRNTGDIVKKLKELDLYDDTIIYITADHGFDEGMKQHHDAPYVFLATNDKKVMRNGLRTDIAPTVLDRFGVDLSKINPPLDGHPLTKKYEPSLW